MTATHQDTQTCHTALGIQEEKRPFLQIQPKISLSLAVGASHVRRWEKKETVFLILNKLIFCTLSKNVFVNLQTKACIYRKSNLMLRKALIRKAPNSAPFLSLPLLGLVRFQHFVSSSLMRKIGRVASDGKQS
jgi:hypothetical protein